MSVIASLLLYSDKHAQYITYGKSQWFRGYVVYMRFSPRLRGYIYALPIFRFRGYMLRFPSVSRLCHCGRVPRLCRCNGSVILEAAHVLTAIKIPVILCWFGVILPASPTWSLLRPTMLHGPLSIPSALSWLPGRSVAQSVVRPVGRPFGRGQNGLSVFSFRIHRYEFRF